MVISEKLKQKRYVLYNQCLSKLGKGNIWTTAKINNRYVTITNKIMLDTLELDSLTLQICSFSTWHLLYITLGAQHLSGLSWPFRLVPCTVSHNNLFALLSDTVAPWCARRGRGLWLTRLRFTLHLSISWVGCH